ncbi:MAG: hypothetical protein A2170_05720 [Deltaproteobacteria bacterium RBG_13_53_10]|nr:MAG: hypothetical protein A2170_05720 [Deltaproteobacteria bacterium RBG_13_53_10]
MEHECDVLVIGGGGAAVRAAVEAVQHGGDILMVNKGAFGRSGTSPLALHGFAATLHHDDSEETLVADILRTGCNINDVNLVRMAARESRQEVALLEKLGVRFLRNADGSYYIYGGGGHSVPHNIIVDEASNGVNPVVLLGMEAWKKGVHLIDGVMMTDLLIDNGRAVGAIGIDREQRIHAFSAGAIVLAAGGANRAYPNVVPRISHPMYGTTGDGYVLALQAGLALVDMEFVNFRDSPPATPIHGTYVNAKGERFMDRYDPIRKEGAPRGKVVEALFREMQAGNGPIHIEIDAKESDTFDFLAEEYKSYVRATREGKRPPVTITFQRVLGGARMNPDTSSEIEGLYIAGENAGGFHGADRLQGAAFLETQVFGRLAGMNSALFARSRTRKEVSKGLLVSPRERIRKISERTEGPRVADLMKKVHTVTWDHGSIVRGANGIKKGLADLGDIREELGKAVGGNPFEVLEVSALALTAETILRSALAREESRGTHLRNDFPDSKEAMARKHICLRYDTPGALQVSVVPSHLG